MLTERNVTKNPRIRIPIGKATPIVRIVGVRASVVSLGDDLKRLHVQRPTGSYILKPPVLFFELLKPQDVARFEPAVIDARHDDLMAFNSTRALGDYFDDHCATPR